MVIYEVGKNMSSKRFANFSMFVKLRASIIGLVYNGHLSFIYRKA